MVRRRVRRGRTTAAGVVAALALGGSATASAAVTVQPFRVPVTAPDESGGAVAIDVDMYLPDGAAGPSGRPFVMVFHGGGGSKASAFDAAHARNYAERGSVALLYSARGHGDSGGQTTIAGPKEIRDLFDVAAWALRRGDRTEPAHPDWGIDPDRVALAGYSQGGLHTNLGQAWADDPALNPYAIRFAALQPGNTPDRVFEALIDRDVVKLSFGVALLGLYYSSTQGRVAPIVDSWLARAGADQPALYGTGDVCDATGHDTTGSSMRADLAARSMGCRLERMTPPTLWMQAFDDTLFPVAMAVRAMAGMKHPANRLYLSMGGHGAPSAPDAVEAEKTRIQLDDLDAVLGGRKPDLPPVVYWSRDPRVAVPAGTPKYPDAAWVRRTARAWPPADALRATYVLRSDGTLGDQPDTDSAAPLQPVASSPADDPALVTLAQQLPNGATLVGSSPSTDAPGAVASFTGPIAPIDLEIAGPPLARLHWTPLGPDTQLVLRVYVQAPDGTRTIVSRGVRGLRGVTPGTAADVEVAGDHTAVLVPRGHRIVATVSAGDATFYKPYAGLGAGVLATGRGSLLDLPLRVAGAKDAGAGTGGRRPRTCRDVTRPVSRVSVPGTRGGRGGLTVRGRATDRGCTGLTSGGAKLTEPRRGRVARVRVSVGREVGGGRCRFLDARGRAGRALPCARPRYVRARGTATFRRSVPGPLRPGVYRITTRATDASGNAERARPSATHALTLRIR